MDIGYNRAAAGGCSVKKILIIEETSLFRDFLAEKLIACNFTVETAINGLDGLSKIRAFMPDLIIMDYFLSRISAIDVLQGKKKDPNCRSVPVILVASHMSKEQLVQVAPYDVKKLFSKPIKVDSLLNTVSELLQVRLDIDSTPSIIEAHFNDGILFIEVAMGLNREKIELLKYKLIELRDLYRLKSAKVLLMMATLDLKSGDREKLELLIEQVLENANVTTRYVKILTNSSFVREVLTGHPEYRKIEISNDLESLMQRLEGAELKPDVNRDFTPAGEKMIRAGAPRKKQQEEMFHMRLESESDSDRSSLDSVSPGQEIRVAVVDDDVVIREMVGNIFSGSRWKVKTYATGREFVSDPEFDRYPIVFLDLMMPEMDGFAVLGYLREKGVDSSVIVLSALSQRESVVRALKAGAKSYMLKPLKPDLIVKKTLENLRVNV